ncbi:helix-turn-helix domain-containing protein [Eubacterium sp. MSJ-21]|nr:helix-turn-helix domain-containing protein [Eubacterium sp. MSJ-21]
MLDNIFYKQVGERVQKEREQQRLTREQLAEQSDISTKFLYEIETGRKGFSCIVLYRVCRALHVNADYILEGVEEVTNRSRIEYMTRGFTDEEMEYLVKMVEGICEFRDKAKQDKIS